MLQMVKLGSPLSRRHWRVGVNDPNSGKKRVLSRTHPILPRTWSVGPWVRIRDYDTTSHVRFHITLEPSIFKFILITSTSTNMSSDLNEPSISLGYIYVTPNSIKPFKINTFMKQPVVELVEDIKDAHEVFTYSQLWIYKVNR